MAEELAEHWVWCNIYTKHIKNIASMLMVIYNDFKKLQSFPKARMTDKWVKEKVEPFLESLNQGLDIRTMDIAFRRKQEDIHGVKETEVEEEFWKDQIGGKRIGFCDGVVDKKWLTQDARRKKDLESMKKRLEKSEREKNDQNEKVEVPEEYEDNVKEDEFVDKNYTEDDDEEEGLKKRKRRRMSGESTDNSGSLLEHYRHIRTSAKSVRPEFYTAVDRCISELHMSNEQATSAITIIAKEMFNLKWKKHNEDDSVVDLDTLPAKPAILVMQRSREALALSSLVEKMMNSDEKTTIVYHDDGSKKQGAGSFSVQGATINKKFYAFPTLSIASETRENLAQLKLTILAILSAVSGVSSEEIWGRINFTMTDSTTHNLKVDDIVSSSLDTEHVPSHLLCQVHPACMFTRVLQKLFKQIDTTIGPTKIFSVFAVSLTDVQDSVTEQWMNCLTRLVTHDFDHKSWNYADEFDIFISPLKNPAKRLQKERFNSFIYTALVTLFLDKHVSSFLDKFTNITNSLACIIRSFEGLDYLRVLAAATVVIGVHLVEPYLNLTTSSSTTWQKLVEAFPSLYTDLSTTKAEKLLDLSSPAFSLSLPQGLSSAFTPLTSSSPPSR